MIAARDAVRRMIDWLGREHGLEPAQAYLLCSVAVDLRVHEIVRNGLIGKVTRVERR